MPSEPLTLTRRSFLSAAAVEIVSSPIWAKAATARVSDSHLLSDIEHRTFYFYWQRVNHNNGLMADRWSTQAVCSITGTGLALSASPIGVERGWITRNQARDITLRTLRFFEQLQQREQRSGIAGYRGFYYHLIDMVTGLRLPSWELSTIDTCWLQMGMAFAQGWFDQEEIFRHADFTDRMIAEHWRLFSQLARRWMLKSAKKLWRIVCSLTDGN